MAILSDLGSCSLETLLTGGALIKTRSARHGIVIAYDLAGVNRRCRGGSSSGVESEAFPREGDCRKLARWHVVGQRGRESRWRG